MQDLLDAAGNARRNLAQQTGPTQYNSWAFAALGHSVTQTVRRPVKPALLAQSSPSPVLPMICGAGARRDGLPNRASGLFLPAAKLRSSHVPSAAGSCPDGSSLVAAPDGSCPGGSLPRLNMHEAEVPQESASPKPSWLHRPSLVYDGILHHAIYA